MKLKSKVVSGYLGKQAAAHIANAHTIWSVNLRCHDLIYSFISLFYPRQTVYCVGAHKVTGLMNKRHGLVHGHMGFQDACMMHRENM